MIRNSSRCCSASAPHHRELLRRAPLRVALLFATVGMARPLAAQRDTASDAALGQAAAHITDTVLARWITALMADSLRERPTPSAALERTARYVAAQFQALGLQPGVRTADRLDTPITEWVQRYPLPGRTVRLDPTQTRLDFVYQLQWAGRDVVVHEDERAQGEKRVTVDFTTATRFLATRVPEPRSVVASVVWGVAKTTAAVLTGRPTAAFLQQAGLGDQAVLYLPPADLDSASRRIAIEQLYAVSRGVVLIEVDSARWSAEQPAVQPPVQVVNTYLETRLDGSSTQWAVVVRAPALGDLLEALGLDVARARTATVPAVRPVPNLAVSLRPVLDPVDTLVPASATAPNVLAMLEGRDSLLKRRCLVIMAPLNQQHANGPSGQSTAADSATNTTSLAGLLTLAQAFRRLATPPPYSVVFLAASGSLDSAFWGSAFYTYRERLNGCLPMAGLALTPLKGGPVVGPDSGVGDVVTVAGLNDVTMMPPSAWLVAQHPELALTVADGGPVLEATSEAAVFAHRSYPSLSIGIPRSTAGTPVTAERQVRQLQFAFYLSYAMASAPPAWSPAGRRRLTQAAGEGRTKVPPPSRTPP